MKPLPQVAGMACRISLAAFLVGTPVWAGEPPTPQPSRAAAHPILNLKPRPAPAVSSSRPKLISPQMSARIKAALADVAPVPPIQPQTETSGSSSVPLDRDPNDPVILMDRFYVSEDKVRSFDPSDLMDEDARRALALKRHPGLVLSGGKLFYNVGEEIIQEELAIERARKMEGLMNLLPTSTKRGRSGLQRRSNSWAETGGSYQASKR